MSDTTIRKATLTDITALKTLADAHKYELGFVRRPALIRSIEHNEIFVAENSTGVIGFIEYHHRKDAQTTLYHIVVKNDYRRLGIGRLLMQTLVVESCEHGQKVVNLKCPTELEANDFYRQVEFSKTDTLKGKERALTVWQLPLDPSICSKYGT